MNRTNTASTTSGHEQICPQAPPSFGAAFTMLALQCSVHGVCLTGLSYVTVALRLLAEEGV